MMNTIIEINPLQARNIALVEAGVDNAEFTRQRVLCTMGRELYELEFSANGMNYTCYIDAIDGSIPGFFCTPTAA